MHNLRSDILAVIKNKVRGKIWDEIDGVFISDIWHYIQDESRVYNWTMFNKLIIQKAKLNPHNW